MEATLSFLRFSQRLTEGVEQHFAWKVRRRKRRDRSPLLATLQDKYAAKLYAAACGVKSAELLYVTTEPATLPFEQLPPNYFVKATHGQNWNIRAAASKLYLYRNGAAGTAEITLTKEACVARCQTWLSRTYSESEWAYTKIKPRILVEAALEPCGDELFDYRFYTFGGKVSAISLGSPRYRKNKLNVFFTPDWQPFNLTCYAEALPHPLPEKPAVLAEMIAAAETLGAATDFVRVDLYNTVQGVMLGELTVYPHAGRVGTPTGCRVFNRWLGTQWASAPR